LIAYIDSTLENLEASWASIVQSCKKLKIDSISPPKFVHSMTLRFQFGPDQPCQDIFLCLDGVQTRREELHLLTLPPSVLRSSGVAA
jgi:hypothetical protein